MDNKKVPLQTLQSYQDSCFSCIKLKREKPFVQLFCDTCIAPWVPAVMMPGLVILRGSETLH
ncbi:MAG: hypothetical protein CSYNP_01618 [Syntrophus sp. SKADARSKE-3]|nr:hypothetical protein [Syntrophus sp. SKADARSKE-3]